MLNINIKRKVLRYAKMVAPYDTGNLRHNAIIGTYWNNPNKFVITYSSKDAHYIEYLEQKEFAGGSKTKKNLHKGFIIETRHAIAKQLENYFYKGLKMPKMKRMNKNELETNVFRSERHKKSLAMYQSQREVN